MREDRKAGRSSRGAAWIYYRGLEHNDLLMVASYMHSLIRPPSIPTNLPRENVWAEYNNAAEKLLIASSGMSLKLVAGAGFVRYLPFRIS